MSAVERELQQRLARLGPAEKQQMLEYARSLEDASPRGTPPSALVRFFGRISAEDAKEMEAAIEEGCERIDQDGW